LQFGRELREGVATGRITVSFRLWSRSEVKDGGRYPLGSAQIEVDSIELMPFTAITDDDTLLHRVEFHVVS
jgi:hypothetical protein